jgi:hypothetical protein
MCDIVLKAGPGSEGGLGRGEARGRLECGLTATAVGRDDAGVRQGGLKRFCGLEPPTWLLREGAERHGFELSRDPGSLVHVIDKRLVGAAREEALLHLLGRNEDNWVTGHITNVLALKR